MRQTILFLLISCVAAAPVVIAVGTAENHTSGPAVASLVVVEPATPSRPAAEDCDATTGDTGGCLAQRQLGTMIERLRGEYPDAPEPSRP